MIKKLETVFITGPDEDGIKYIKADDSVILGVTPDTERMLDVVNLKTTKLECIVFKTKIFNRLGFYVIDKTGIHYRTGYRNIINRFSKTKSKRAKYRLAYY